MIPSSAPALVAACTAVFGLHSSSSTVSSYSYFALGSALRSLTARSAELRPPRPFAATPPVSGPMKATFTLSLAAAGPASESARSAAATLAACRVLLMEPLLVSEIGACSRSAPRGARRVRLLFERDLVRKPGPTPDQVRGRHFRDHALLKHGLDLVVVLLDQLDVG